jgi:hypothetical protein
MASFAWVSAWDLTFFRGISTLVSLTCGNSPRTMAGKSRVRWQESQARTPPPSSRFYATCCGSLDFTRYSVNARAREINGEEGYGFIESDVLFAFITRHLPPRII